MVHTIFIAVWAGLFLVFACSDGTHVIDKLLGLTVCFWIPVLYVMFNEIGLFK